MRFLFTPLKIYTLRFYGFIKLVKSITLKIPIIRYVACLHGSDVDIIVLHADIIMSRTESFCFDRPSYEICILQTNVLCNK